MDRVNTRVNTTLIDVFRSCQHPFRQPHCASPSQSVYCIASRVVDGWRRGGERLHSYRRCKDESHRRREQLCDWAFLSAPEK